MGLAGCFSVRAAARAGHLLCVLGLLGAAPGAARAAPETDGGGVKRTVAVPLAIQDGLGARLYLPLVLHSSAPPEVEPSAPRSVADRPVAEIQLANANELTGVALDEPRGEVWAGSHGGGVLRWDVRTGTHTRFTAPGDIPDNRVYAVAIDADGRRWIGTGAGAAVLEPGASDWSRVELAPSVPLDGAVRAVVSTDDGVLFGIDGAGVRLLGRDGTWMAWLGARARIDAGTPAAFDAPLQALPGAAPLAGTAPVAADLAWYGEACRDVRAGGAVRDRIALVALPEEGCPVARAANDAADLGARAVLVYGARSPVSPAMAYAGGVPIPVLGVSDELGLSLEARARRGEPVPVVLSDDGLPPAARRVNALLRDPDDTLWIGTIADGAFVGSPGGGWRHLQSEPPIEVSWADGRATYPAFEFFNTPRLAGRPLEGEVAWVGSACPQDPAFEDVRGRIALIQLTFGGCTTEEKLDRMAAQGAVGVLGFSRTVAVSEMARGGNMSGRLAPLPALDIPVEAADRLIALRTGGVRARVRTAPRLTDACINAIARDSEGRHWLGSDDCVTVGGMIAGGITVVPPGEPSAWDVHTTWAPMPYGLVAKVDYPRQPEDAVHQMAFGPDGTLWVATEGGLRSLEPASGTWSTRSHASSGGGLDDDRLRGVAVGSDGGVWAATASGLARFHPEGERWFALRSDPLLASNWLSALAPEAGGGAWLGSGASETDGSQERYVTRGGLMRLSADGLVSEHATRETTGGALSDDSVQAVLEDAEGTVWVGTASSLARRDAGDATWRAVPQDATVRFTWAAGERTLRALEPRLGPWTGRIEGEAALYGPGCGPPVQSVQGRIALVDMTDGCTSIALVERATNQGAVAVIVALPEDQAGIDLDELLSGYTVRTRIPAVYVDADEGAVVRAELLRGGRVMAAVRSARWYRDGGIDAIAADADGTMWFAGVGAAYRMSRDDVWSAFHWRNAPLAGASGSAIQFLEDIEVDVQGRRWVGGSSWGSAGFGEPILARLSADGRSWTSFRDAIRAGVGPRAGIQRIALDPDNAAWIATQGDGVSVLSPGDVSWRKATRASTQGGLPSDTVRDLAFDPDGGLYAATDEGVAYRPAAPFEDPSAGWRTLPIAARAANRLQLLPDGDLLVATLGAGLVRLSRHEAGADCAAAQVLAPGAVISTTLSGQSDIDLYALRVDKPFSRVELTVADPDHQLDFFLRHSCVGIGASGRHIGASGRHIGASGRHIGGTGRHIGGTGRHIGADQRLVFDVLADPGTFYVDIRPRIGTDGGTIGYRLRSGLSEVDLESRRTLILTDADAVRNAFGLAADSAEHLDWIASLQALQADAGVAGLLITDLKAQTNEAVREAYADWVTNEDPAATTAKANAVAEALRGWIWERRATDMPKLQYIVLAGDDRIVPHFRQAVTAPADGSGWQGEAEYLAGSGIDAESTVGTALAEGRILTDDGYGAPGPAGWGAVAPGLAVPELAVGRLVERPSTMAATVDAFLARGGATELAAALVVDAPPMDDVGAAAAGVLAETGLAASERARLSGAGGGEVALTAALARRRDAVVLAVPGGHDGVRLADGTTLTPEALDRSAAVTGTLVLSLASHGGLNVPGPGHARGADWAEAWAEHGATYIGTTGWAYGMAGGLQYAEKLAAEVVRQALQGDGRVVGDALVAAKQAYAADVGEESAYHAATLAGMVLYGLPMARMQVTTVGVDVGVGDAAEGDWGADAAVLAEGAEGRTAGEAVEVAAGVWRVAVTQAIGDPERRTGDGGRTYLAQAGVQAWLEAGEAAQPRLRMALPELVVGTRSVPARGVVWLGTTSREAGTEAPWVPVAWPSGAGAAPGAAGAPVGGAWQAVGLRAWGQTELVGDVLVGRREGQLDYRAGWYDAERGVERVAERVATEEYYSEAADREPPAVGEVTLGAEGGATAVSARVSDASGVLRVVAAWTADGATWASAELADAGDGTWRGAVPAGARWAVVQAVDRAGNVGRATAVAGP